MGLGVPGMTGRGEFWFSGVAGDLAAEKTGQISLTAGDILRGLPEAFKALIPS